ncbi:WXG100 family type VII secretion target [Kineococcus endophyticus]|uniref:ESAT-6-like protein n=1 Tax=Kineococcus endophyticus TaxID=1181883 RepID=A0ABV3P891_9ACTN
MSRFEVDSARVEQASTAVAASATNLAAEVDGMMRHLLDLESCWKGQAASGFQALSAQWRVTQDRVRTSLEDIQRALAQAGRQYADVESANARMFAS